MDIDEDLSLISGNREEKINFLCWRCLCWGSNFRIFASEDDMNRCISGKRMYSSQQVAEDVLIESWTRFDYTASNGPLSVYKCDDCGQFHLTSAGPMNERLSKALAEGGIRRQKEADRWLDKLKRR